MNKTYRYRRKSRNVYRILCLGLVILLVATILNGCIWYKELRLPQLGKFQQNVHKDYPDTSISCEYEYGAGVFIAVKGRTFDVESAYTILGYLQPIVSDKDFIKELFELFEKESHSDPNWKNGRRPEIWLYLCVDGKDRYRFTARAYKEVYNSGRSPDSYTWDGYTTWYGTEIVNDSVREITSDKLKEEIQKYS